MKGGLTWELIIIGHRKLAKPKMNAAVIAMCFITVVLSVSFFELSVSISSLLSIQRY